jgi:hypothetical protein
MGKDTGDASGTDLIYDRSPCGCESDQHSLITHASLLLLAPRREAPKAVTLHRVAVTRAIFEIR